MDKTLSFSGFFGNGQKFNPDFYNWNRIKVRYCDGSSFTGDVEAVNPAINLHFRGARVLVAVTEDLLAKGMKNAKNAILSGCSAGGLTSIIHCDRFKTLLPAAAKVKCLSDAGYFSNTKTISGTKHIEQLYSQVVKTHVLLLVSHYSPFYQSTSICYFIRHLQAAANVSPLSIWKKLLKLSYDYFYFLLCFRAQQSICQSFDLCSFTRNILFPKVNTRTL